MYVGLMSGTSMDGIDSVLVSFGDEDTVCLHRSTFEPYSSNLKSKLKQLLADPDPASELAQGIESQLGNFYSAAVQNLIKGLSSRQIKAIGCHGQTIIHQPHAKSPHSWQAGNGDIIAKQTGITVVNDFRTADLEAGGEGAPLAPVFHHYAFGSREEARCVVNIGGISNVTYLPADEKDEVVGFDTGPGNSLSDMWVNLHLGKDYDQDGNWALSAKADENLLCQMLADPFFDLPPPKSLDCRYFSQKWLQKQIDATDGKLTPVTVQSTIAAFTAESIWHGIQTWLPPVGKIFLCGGGSHNQAIQQHLAKISGLPTKVTDELGVKPEHVEACTMAWLARQRLNSLPANIPSVTGAQKEVLLGNIIHPS